MDELVAWVRAQVSEDEALAQSAIADPDAYSQWDCPTTGVVQTAGGDLDGLVQARPPIARHIARWDPARVLAEVEAKRRRIALILEAIPTDPSSLIGYHMQRTLEELLEAEAHPYADRPGFKDEWRLT